MGEKILLGFGNNIDYEIQWNAAVLESLIKTYGIRASDIDPGLTVDSEKSLVCSILGFFKAGGGGERFVEDPSLIERFAARFFVKRTLGGTAVRAALAIRRLGFTSALHLVTLNDEVRRLLPEGCSYVCSAEKDSSFPHLIVQFCQGDRICAGDIDLLAPRANRIIYDHDLDNMDVRLNGDFAGMMGDARALVISGFNAMHDGEQLVRRMEALLEMTRALPGGARVFFEDGCFCDRELSKICRSMLMPAIDIYSMNEDEWQQHLGREVNLLDAAQVRKALEDTEQVVSAPHIVVHTRYWALAFGHDAADFSHALEGGVCVAAARLLFGDDYAPDTPARLTRALRRKDGEIFARAIEAEMGSQVCCVPSVQVKEAGVTTIGLGDAFVGGFLVAMVNPETFENENSGGNDRAGKSQTDPETGG